MLYYMNAIYYLTCYIEQYQMPLNFFFLKRRRRRRRRRRRNTIRSIHIYCIYLLKLAWPFNKKMKKKKKKRIVPPKTLFLIGTFGVLYGVSSSPELMGWATIHFKLKKKKNIYNVQLCTNKTMFLKKKIYKPKHSTYYTTP